jgi:signal transduction histidine kinase
VSSLSTQHVRDVRTASIRVALVAAGVVAAIYLVVAVAVVTIVSHNLTSQIDTQLADSLSHINRQPQHPQGGYGPPPDRGPFEPNQVVWTIRPDGEVDSNMPTAALPATDAKIIGPETISIGGTNIRVRGAMVGDDYVVVGQTTRSVSEAESTIILAEIGIGPILVLVVFLGAVVIGRRVAAPVEAARQRQMEFTADASHELRTPLSVIEAHTSLALTQDRSPEWYRAAFQRVDRESKRMSRLLDDLLWLARFDVTHGQPHAEPVDLAVLAAQAVDRFGIVAEARHLRLDVRAASGTNVVTAPPEWLDRLLGVLLDNACKYSPEGGSVTVSVAGDGGRIRVTVDDSGPGIPEDERPRVFDRFHRATNQASGAGLGLAIADAIVRATGGRWRVGSSPAGGASMSVSWPRSFSGPRESPASPVSAPATSSGMSSD